MEASSVNEIHRLRQGQDEEKFVMKLMGAVSFWQLSGRHMGQPPMSR